VALLAGAQRVMAWVIRPRLDTGRDREADPQPSSWEPPFMPFRVIGTGKRIGESAADRPRDRPDCTSRTARLRRRASRRDRLFRQYLEVRRSAGSHTLACRFGGERRAAGPLDMIFLHVRCILTKPERAPSFPPRPAAAPQSRSEPSRHCRQVASISQPAIQERRRPQRPQEFNSPPWFEPQS
jgi:hypothetical protein